MKHNPKLNKTIKVTLGTQKRLERLKKGEFKRKFKTKSINDVIAKLLDIYDEYVIIKEQVKGVVETGRISKKTLQREPQTREEWFKQRREEMEEEELPDICRDCAKYSRCTNTWIHDPEEVEERKCFIPRVQCVFRSVREDGMLDCAKDFSKNRKIHKVTKEFCEKCWNRKQFIQRKMQRDQEEKYPRIRCSLKNTTFKIEKDKDFLQLPCIMNPMFTCKNQDCQKHVFEIIEKWKRREK